MHPILNKIKQRHDASVEFIRKLVKCESPSDTPAAVNALADLIVEETKDIAKAKTFRCGPKYGKAVLLDFDLPGPKRRTGTGVLGLGHMDTVWPVGTLRTMPFQKREGRLWGPGVLDMKSGIAFFIMAVRALREMDMAVQRPVRLWLVPDEEVGSEGSRPLTEKRAKENKSVLVLEPGTGLEGHLKTARKGIGNYTLTVRGKAAHAGVDFSDGASAIVELARQVERLSNLTDLRAGVTVNPGLIWGGTRRNVVAEEARAEIDVRVDRLREWDVLDRRIRRFLAIDRRCRLHWEGGLNRPPMERTRGVAAIYQVAEELAKKYLNRKLQESSTGGGSDGNFTAAMRIPTLDGIGGVGEGAHAKNESILENRMDDRTALIALLIHHLGQSK